MHASVAIEMQKKAKTMGKGTPSKGSVQGYLGSRPPAPPVPPAPLPLAPAGFQLCSAPVQNEKGLLHFGGTIFFV